MATKGFVGLDEGLLVHSGSDDCSIKSFYSSSNVSAICRDKELDYIKVSVSDTGVGMSEDVIRGLFELFGNSKLSNNVNKTGIGLGLTVSH